MENKPVEEPSETDTQKVVLRLNTCHSECLLACWELVANTRNRRPRPMIKYIPTFPWFSFFFKCTVSSEVFNRCLVVGLQIGLAVLDFFDDDIEGGGLSIKHGASFGTESVGEAGVEAAGESD